ncbi:unnamed protein product [Bursaphelenchus xylophilus]|nr:unnamed protein product [Bursaphelenchus xylophilus]CAG9128144.1 unnamed protein product [Bursaphelenchus xylophilus]
MFEGISGIRVVTNTASMKKSKCFWLQSGNIIIENAEVYMIFAVSLDRQLAIQEPVKYRTWKIQKYVILMTIPAAIYGLAYWLWSFATLVDKNLEICNLPTSMPDVVSEYWNYTSTFACFLTVFCYGCTFAMLYKLTPKALKGQQGQLEQQKRIAKTLSINVFGFFISSVASSAIIIVFRNAGVSEEIVGEAETYAVIPGLLSYSLNYYIYFWRSSEYRRAFAQQLGLSENFFLRGQETMFGPQNSQVTRISGVSPFSVSVSSSVMTRISQTPVE